MICSVANDVYRVTASDGDWNFGLISYSYQWYDIDSLHCWSR